jgi:F-type H+-transporting ATPase subunit epsilon
MADKVAFELVSPERLLTAQSATMVVVPGADGYFGVLAGHAPMIVTVKPGVIDVYGQDMTTITSRVFIAGGFCEVTDTRCTVLAEEATDVASLDRSLVDQQLRSLTVDLADAKTDFERRTLEGRLAVAQAKLAVLDAGSVH